MFLFRVKSGLAPFLSQVSERKSELTKFDKSIASKKTELRNYQNQIEKVASNFRLVLESYMVVFSKRLYILVS